MKNTITLTFLLLVLTCSASAQDAGTAAVASAVEALRKALVDPDRNVLEQLTSPDLSYGHSNGLIEDQKAFIQALVSGPTDIESLDLMDQTIRITGKTAVVRHIFLGALNNQGTKSTIKLSVLQVWIKQGKGWKLLARQAARLQQ